LAVFRLLRQGRRYAPPSRIAVNGSACASSSAALADVLADDSETHLKRLESVNNPAIGAIGDGISLCDTSAEGSAVLFDLDELAF
jgi:hypothetical protein